MRVALLHSPLGVGDYPALPGDAHTPMDDSDLIEPVSAACRANGHEPFAVPVDDSPSVTLNALRHADVVFNLVETIHRDTRFTAAAAWLLEWAGMPYTGATPEALTIALDKPTTKAVLAAHGVGVPSGCVLYSPEDPLTGVTWPAIVKPAREDASTGIDAGSLVADETAARDRARLVIETFRQPVIVEAFLDGREIMASVLGAMSSLQVLPLREARYDDYPNGVPHILTFAAKWDPASSEGRLMRRDFVEDLSQVEYQRIHEVALKAWRALDFRHYGRIDMRLDDQGVPHVIEANPNPDLVPGECFPASALAAGLSYDHLIGHLIELALTDVRSGR